jgi:hypothetical protein
MLLVRALGTLRVPSVMVPVPCGAIGTMRGGLKQGLIAAVPSVCTYTKKRLPTGH